MVEFFLVGKVQIPQETLIFVALFLLEDTLERGDSHKGRKMALWWHTSHVNIRHEMVLLRVMVRAWAGVRACSTAVHLLSTVLRLRSAGGSKRSVAHNEFDEWFCDMLHVCYRSLDDAGVMSRSTRCIMLSRWLKELSWSEEVSIRIDASTKLTRKNYKFDSNKYWF